MARPRKASGEAADTRLINALWALLESKRLSDITVGMVTTQAGLNRGTFYYHFNSMNELIDRAIEDEVAGRNSIMQNIFSMMAGSPITGEAESVVEQRMHKIALLVKQGGVDVLSAKVKSLAIRTWRAVLRNDDEPLTPETLLVIEYATSGAIGIVARNSLSGNADVPPEFYFSFIKRNSEFLLNLVSETQGVPRETVVNRLQATIRLNQLL